MNELSHSNSGMENGSSHCVTEAGKRCSTSPGFPAKRLKQACLQFKSIAVGGIGNYISTKNAKKRPFSSSEEDVKNANKSENEDSEPNSRSMKTVTSCKENQGPSELKNRSDPRRKAKCIKSPNTTKLARSVDTSEEGPNLIVDLTCETSNESAAGSTKCCDQRLTSDSVGDRSAKIRGSDVSSVSCDLETRAQQVSAEILEQKTTSIACEFDFSDEPNKQQFGQIDNRNPLFTVATIDHVDTDDRVNDSIKVIASGFLIAKDSNQSNTLADSASKSLSSELDLRIKSTIEAVILNSSNVEDFAVADRNDLTTQDKVPTRRKKLTKVRSSSESLAKDKEMQEKLKVQLEIARLRAELKKQKDEAKQQREKDKVEALAKRKKDEMEKIERLQLKEEEKRKKQESLQTKSEEKQKKAKERQEKEDEKKKAEEEEQKKKDKVKEAFVSFFVKKDLNQTANELENVVSVRPIENVQHAPLFRNSRSNSVGLVMALDSALSLQSCSVLYLEQLQNKQITPGKSQRVLLVSEKEVEIIESNSETIQPLRRLCRAKLLQFSENVRPPYWGTWRKKSKMISSRAPFTKDDIFVDYEVDSEAEWEEEEPGESLSNSEGEKESEDEYEVDNEFFVPHGYLSEEEDQDEDGKPMSPDEFKAQLKIKQKEFEIERRRKCQQLKPSVLGCFWMNGDQHGNEELAKVLDAYSAVLLTSCPIETRYSLLLPPTNTFKSPSPVSTKPDKNPPSSQTNLVDSKLQQTFFTPTKHKKSTSTSRATCDALIDLTDDDDDILCKSPMTNNT